MGIIGAILGDIAGSKWEFTNNRGRLFTIPNLFEHDSYFTDDTVMSIATMDAIENNLPFDATYRKWGKKYPDAGYGPSFYGWLNNEEQGPYNSLGNGSAMRSSYIGEKYKSRKKVEKMAEKSASVTHNHPEGIKGAVTIAVCVWMAERMYRHTDNHNEKKMKKIKEKILQYGIKQYPSTEYKYGCDIPIKEYKRNMSYDVTCMGSVPVAIRCFYETDSFKECMKLICSMNCDADTIGAMAGAICDSFYKGCFRDMNKAEMISDYISETLEILILNRYLTDELFNQVIKHSRYDYLTLFTIWAAMSEGPDDEQGVYQKQFDEYYRGMNKYIEINKDDYEKFKRRLDMY